METEENIIKMIKGNYKFVMVFFGGKLDKVDYQPIVCKNEIEISTKQAIELYKINKFIFNYKSESALKTLNDLKTLQNDL